MRTALSRPFAAAALLAAGCDHAPPDDRPVEPGVAQPATWEQLDPSRPGAHLRDPRTGIAFVRIEPGEFVMGSERPDEGPPRTVRITRPFLLATTEVTAAAFGRFVASSGAGGDLPLPAAADLPVPASWRDAQRFCAHFGYRLPTEAEWEFACLGGRDPDDPAWRDPERIAGTAWCHTNAGDGSRPVATREPNGFGLFDMLGNVWEWCSDRYVAGHAGRPDPDVDPEGPPPAGGPGDQQRVLRGGSWFTLPAPGPHTRTVGNWNERNDFYGFRPAVTLPGPAPR